MRCYKAGLKKRCLKYCGICCAACNCVPSGTYGNKSECPSYRDKLNSKGTPSALEMYNCYFCFGNKELSNLAYPTSFEPHLIVTYILMTLYPIPMAPMEFGKSPLRKLAEDPERVEQVQLRMIL
ncbi:hypothetical protein RJ639_007115 [Escallonia herrerae]|uniref:Uncharacterized protein n=1 Tax=Escallonia herrerae TaxID=1293975 RepID=A0AA88VWE7_9ASTE|nr:hypothetical protein RJ639_007115 [Escallonia herrerae]